MASLQRQMLVFANLLEIAQVSAKGGKQYEEQEALVAFCRKEAKPFLAVMPLRHLYSCKSCGTRTGEAILHFEDPRQPVEAGSSEESVFGAPAGRFVVTNRSALHHALVHDDPVPEGLAKLFEEAAR